MHRAPMDWWTRLEHVKPSVQSTLHAMGGLDHRPAVIPHLFLPQGTVGLIPRTKEKRISPALPRGNDSSITFEFGSEVPQSPSCGTARLLQASLTGTSCYTCPSPPADLVTRRQDTSQAQKPRNALADTGPHMCTINTRRWPSCYISLGNCSFAIFFSTHLLPPQDSCLPLQNSPQPDRYRNLLMRSAQADICTTVACTSPISSDVRPAMAQGRALGGPLGAAAVGHPKQVQPLQAAELHLGHGRGGLLAPQLLLLGVLARVALPRQAGLQRHTHESKFLSHKALCNIPSHPQQYVEEQGTSVCACQDKIAAQSSTDW